MVRKEGCIAGTGFFLLLGWIAVFVNIITTQKVETSADWHKRFDSFSASDGPTYSDDDHLLVLATSLMSTDVGHGGVYDMQDLHNPIAELQRNTLYFLSTMPGVVGVAYVDDEMWMKECQQFNVKCYNNFP